MKTKSSKSGLVLQGYFRSERFRGAGKKAALLQPRAPRPELLPTKMRAEVGQLKPTREPETPWRGAPRPELLPGMGPARVIGPRRAMQAQPSQGVSTTPILPGQLRIIGEGRPLEPVIRQTMESFFGADFSGVRVHEGPAATSMGALAFTLGEELHFAPGLYAPSTREGVELLGHELTHVVQQRDGRVANPYGRGVAVVQDPALEAEADRMGQRIAELLWSGARGRRPSMGMRASGEGPASPRASVAWPLHRIVPWRASGGAILPSKKGVVITKNGLENDDYLFVEAATGGVSTPPVNTVVKMQVRILKLSDVDYKQTATLINVALGGEGWFPRNTSSDSPFHQNTEKRLPHYTPTNTGVQPYLEYLVPGMGGARIVVDLASDQVYLSYHYGDASAKSGKFPKWVTKSKVKISPFVELDPNTWNCGAIIQDAANWWQTTGLHLLGNPGT
jgi:hypothetical protein